MIGLRSGTRIYLCTEPVDFREGFDGLTGIVSGVLGRTVTDGSPRTNQYPGQDSNL